ncbi:MAG TPA: hypothetical protein VNO84_16920 [Burkholderiaceae bacterium]|nr:hypothetical protein [Burkholderiaceae bacterium]
MKKLWPLGLLALTLALTSWCYWAGLDGPFLFDDAPNLEALGELGGVQDWSTFKAYVLSGWSGPTGRPLSLVSFLVDDNTWPSVASDFKPTNLKLHLICGLLLTWATYLLLRAAEWDEGEAAGVAVLSASVWMLHPFFVSTTLYVVQRMTVLCTLFMLFGMVGYLKGRLWLKESGRPPAHGYVLMSLSVGFGTVLAVLSKENGALLPLLLLVVEFFLRRAGGSGPRLSWIGPFLVLPAAAVVAYLVSLVDFSPNPWPTRPFNQIERLYSEARIVWDYLGSLWLPRVEGSGLYQDGFEISRSLTQPISTLWAVLGLTALLAALPFLYHHLPFVWLALAFFFCGHLIESTVVGLELHFEHRNYAPALFMFLPLAVGIRSLSRQFSGRVAGLAGLGVIAMVAGLTWQRCQLWADGDRLQTYWAVSSPESARGKNFLIGRLVAEKRYGEALTWANQSIVELPDSSLLTLTWLRLHVNTKQATSQHFERAAEKLARQPFDAQTVVGLRTLTDDVAGTEALAEYRRPTLQLLEYLSAHGPYREFPLFMRLIPYNEAKLYLSLRNPVKAYEKYRLAMDRYATASAAMQMFAEMANAGYLREAAQMLDDIERGITAGSYDVAPLGVAYYRNEIARMKQLLAESDTFEGRR